MQGSSTICRATIQEMPQVEGRGEKISWEARERWSFMASSTREEVAGRLARELKSSYTAAGILKDNRCGRERRS